MSPARVALVLVSHSRTLAEAVAALAGQMTGGEVTILCAAGTGEGGDELGTDALRIVAALNEVDGPAGTVVLMDLGSAVLSAGMALDFLDEEVRARVSLCAAPFVEGAVAAAAAALGGADRAVIAAEAMAALAPKRQQLGGEEEVAQPAAVVGAHTAEAAIPDPHGLHARPAARLVELAGRLGGAITVENLDNGRGPVSAASLVALLSLQATQGHRLRIAATDAAAARAMVDLVATFRGDVEAAPMPVAGEGRAVPISAGVAIGPVVRLVATDLPAAREPAGEPALERARLEAALAVVRKRLGEPRDALAGAMLGVQAALLADPALRQRALALIDGGERLGAAAALARAADEAAAVFARQADPYLRAREADLRDAVGAVLRELAGGTAALGLPEEAGVLLTEDLPPSLAAALDPARVLGVIDRRGGPTSHAAILLRAAGIPAVAGAAALVPADVEGPIAFDGGTGEVWLAPGEAERREIEARRAAAAKSEAPLPGGTVTLAGGRTVELWANVAGRVDAEAAHRAGAFGIGLLRTEMTFLERATAPGEEEQVAGLAAILAPFRGAPVVVRTLDAGGDKPIPYMGLAPEANPYLGLRGLRLSLARRSLFETQLRAILRAGHGHDLRIMLPMVTEPAEVVEARAVLAAAHAALAREGVAHAWPVPVGIMVEVPAAALAVRSFEAVADFFSIGTNDLTQYTLAAERGHPALHRFADPLHPAVLELVRRVAASDRPVSVCGEAAGEPKAAKALVEAGITRLSMGAAAIPKVAAVLWEGRSPD
jgi:phosphocarrier protein FPr